MARLYAYKCIQAEERKLQEQFENLPNKRQKDHTPDNQTDKGTETGRFLPAGTEM